MLARETFKKLVVIMSKLGSLESKNIDGVEYRAYHLSELTLVLARFGRGWTPEGLMFEMLGSEMFLTPDGNVSVTDDEDPENGVYDLQDAELLGLVSSFLKWRLNVIMRLKV